MLEFWHRFQSSRKRRRWTVKVVIVAVTVFFVCWPYPSRLIQHLQHYRDLDAMIQPDASVLSPLYEELRPKLIDVSAGADALKIVERFVYEKVPYDWDWNTWGVVDYLPSVEETLAAGYEDCDGQAVVAASLLRGLGYEASLVTDAVHMWVQTDQGETMSPGKMDKIVESTEDGAVIRWSALTNMPKAIAYGLAVFPLFRELIVVAVIWILALKRGMNRAIVALALVVFVDGLLLLRAASTHPWTPNVAGQWFAVANLVLGLYLLRRATRQSQSNNRAKSSAAG